MRKTLSIFILIPLLMSSIAFCQQIQPPANAAQMQAGLDDEALEWFNEFFSQFTEDELNEFAQIGEKYIEEEMKKGKDLDTILNEVFEPFETPLGPDPAQPLETTTTVQSPVPTPTLPTVDAKTLDDIRMLLKTIVNKIEIIRQRANHDRKSREMLKPWQYHLDDLIYFAHQLSQEKLIKYLMDKEFAELLTAIRQLLQELSFYEPLFQPQETAIEVENPYEILGLSPAASLETVQERYQTLMKEKSPERIRKEMTQEGKSPELVKQAIANAKTEQEALQQSYSTITAQEQSRQALYAIIEALARAIYTNDMFGQIKKLMQKYEPEALKIKEAQEKREGEARKEQEKLLQMRARPAPYLFDFGFGTTPTTSDRIGGIPYTPYTPYTPTEGTGDLGGLDTSRPGGPGAPTKPGEKPKPSKPGEKKPEEEKKKEEADKKAKKKAEVPKNVADKYKKLDSALEAIQKILDTSPDERGKGPSKTKTRDTLKNFQTMLQKEIGDASDPSNPELLEAINIKNALVDITDKLNEFKRELRDLKGFSRQEKIMLKNSATVRFDKFVKEYLEKYMTDVLSTQLTDTSKLITPAGDKDVPKGKKFIFFGINEFANIDAPENKNIKDANKAIEQEAEGDLPRVRPTNFISSMKKSIHAIREALKPTTNGR
jgi:hypothetical protein